MSDRSNYSDRSSNFEEDEDSDRSEYSDRSVIAEEREEPGRSEHSHRSVIAEEVVEDLPAEKNIGTIKIVFDQLSRFVLRVASDHIKK